MLSCAGPGLPLDNKPNRETNICWINSNYACAYCAIIHVSCKLQQLWNICVHDSLVLKWAYCLPYCQCILDAPALRLTHKQTMKLEPSSEFYCCILFCGCSGIHLNKWSQTHKVAEFDLIKNGPQPSPGNKSGFPPVPFFILNIQRFMFTHLSWRSHIGWRTLLRGSHSPSQTWWRAGFLTRPPEMGRSSRSTFPRADRSRPLHLGPPHNHICREKCQC